MGSKLEKSYKREKARRKRQYGHKVSGRSVFTIQAVLIKKGSK